jgi:hypothetical protein
LAGPVETEPSFPTVQVLQKKRRSAAALLDCWNPRFGLVAELYAFRNQPDEASVLALERNFGSARNHVRQLNVCQPEIVNALHEFLKRVQLHGLQQIAVGLKFVTLRNVLCIFGSGQDKRRD